MIIENLRHGHPALCQNCGIRIELEIELDNTTIVHKAFEEDYIHLAEILNEYGRERFQIWCNNCTPLSEKFFIQHTWRLFCQKKLNEP